MRKNIFELRDYAEEELNLLLDKIIDDCDYCRDTKTLEKILFILKDAIPEIEETIYQINRREREENE